MCSEKETVDISKGNAKMILILLVLCCLLKHATSIPAIDPQPLANLINGFMEKSLKHGEMQVLMAVKSRDSQTRDVEAVYLQTASVSTPIASASTQIHRNFAIEIRPVPW